MSVTFLYDRVHRVSYWFDLALHGAINNNDNANQHYESDCLQHQCE